MFRTPLFDDFDRITLHQLYLIYKRWLCVSHWCRGRGFEPPFQKKKIFCCIGPGFFKLWGGGESYGTGDLYFNWNAVAKVSTDSQVLADPMKRQDPLHNLGNWNIRPSQVPSSRTLKIHWLKFTRLKQNNKTSQLKSSVHLHGLYVVGQIYYYIIVFLITQISCPVKAQIVNLNVQSFILLYVKNC